MKRLGDSTERGNLVLGESAPTFGSFGPLAGASGGAGLARNPDRGGYRGPAQSSTVRGGGSGGGGRWLDRRETSIP